MIKNVTVELTKDEVSLIMKYLHMDICAGCGCLDIEAEGCETCKITTITSNVLRKLESAECELN